MIGVLFFTFFKSVPPILLTLYEWLVYLICIQPIYYHDLNIGPLYGIFEVMQFTNLVFMVSRYLYKRIDSNNIAGHKAEFIALLGISIGGIGVTGYYIYEMYYYG